MPATVSQPTGWERSVPDSSPTTSGLVRIRRIAQWWWRNTRKRSGTGLQRSQQSGARGPILVGQRVAQNPLGHHRSRVTFDRLAGNFDSLILQPNAHGGVRKIAQHGTMRTVTSDLLQQKRAGFTVPMQAHQDRGVVVAHLRIFRVQRPDASEGLLGLTCPAGPCQNAAQHPERHQFIWAHLGNGLQRIDGFCPSAQTVQQHADPKPNDRIERVLLAGLHQTFKFRLPRVRGTGNVRAIQNVFEMVGL